MLSSSFLHILALSESVQVNLNPQKAFRVIQIVADYILW